VKLEASVRYASWRSPLRAAHTSESDATPPRPLVLVRLQAADGSVGYGEAAPLADYDAVTLDQVLAALRLYEPVCAAGAGLSHAELLAVCAASAPLPQALAAIDLALWDLAGQRAGQPVWQLLGAREPPIVELNAAVGADHPDPAARQASDAVERGFQCIKLKVGVGDDLARVRAVRDAVGPHVRLRLDANGAWRPDQAIQTLASLAGFNIELCEEPVHGLPGIAAVAAALPDLAVAADESAADPALFKARVCAAVCLKISRCGGISGILRDASAARAAGYEVYLASTLDGPLGIAAALHAAAVLDPTRACGLATLDRFQAPEVLPLYHGRMAPAPGPGLGDGLISWYDSI